MAGVTSSITSNVSFTSKYQLTTEDDFLTIRGATVTLLSPQGEIFTREGDDTVQVEDSLIDAKADNLQFFLGDGNDKLTARNATFSVPVKTGNGNDTVIIDGAMQNKVRLNRQLSFGTGNDTLELTSVLENAGGIDFGTDGIKTLRFNGGSLAPVSSGIVTSFTNLEVTNAGGTTESNLTLSGEQTSITLNGDFSGKSVRVSGGTTTLSVRNNVRTAVGLSLNQVNLIQTSGGSLEFSGGSIWADYSTVSLHDIAGNVILSGSDTVWTLEKADFVGAGIDLTNGSMNFREVSLGNHTSAVTLAVTLHDTQVTGSKFSLLGNKGGGINAYNADVDITDFRANNNSGTAVIQSGGAMTLTSATFSGNKQIKEVKDIYGTCHAYGGGICCVGGFLTLNSATFSGNFASACFGYSTGTGEARAYGGAVFLSGAVANMENVQFASNSTWASTDYTNSKTSSFDFGGAIYLAGNATLNYVVTSGKQITNSRNRAGGIPTYDSNGIVRYSSLGGGGWLYLAGGNANITVETGGKLIIGDDKGYDSIEGTSGNRITKLGSGYMLVNSYIDDNKLQWSVSEGTLELAKYSNGMLSYSTGKWFGRTIHLDNWTIGTNGKLVLSVLDDTISMGKSNRIGTLDLGGGADTINTGGYDLSDGTILFGNLTISGGGRVGSQLRNRSATEGSTLTLDSVGLESKFFGNAFVDTITANGISSLGDVAMGGGDDAITLSGDCTFSGEVDMGTGTNSVHVNGTLSADKFKMTQGGKTTVYVYLGSMLGENRLTVYADEYAQRETVTLDWSDQTGLDKVRILVSGDPSTFGSEEYEFAVELYNQTKSFTLDLQKGYFLQFQAQDDNGWKQRLLTDHEAPDQVTGVRLGGNTLSWDAAHDNLGGNGVKQYRVEIARDKSFSSIWKSETVTGTEYAMSSLPESALYFRVCAEDYTNNIGAWSETVSSVFDQVPPSVPANVQAAVDGYSATLSWSASTDGGSGVSQYEYRIAADSDYSQIIASGTTDACSVTRNGLRYGTYYCQVRAEDVSGNIGGWSVSRSFTTVDAVAPGTPSNLSFRFEDGKNLSVCWDAVSDDASGSGLKEYELQLATDSSFNTNLRTFRETSLETVIGELPNATYYMRVRAVDNAGNKSDWSAMRDFLIDRDTVAPTISDIRASITDPTSQDVIVTAAFSDNVALQSRQYRIGEDGAWTDYGNGVTVTENTTVYFKAVDTSGNTTEASYVVSNILPKPNEGIVLINESRTVNPGQVYVDTTISSGGRLTVLFEGAASATTVSRGGVMYVSGGSVDRVEIKSGGSLVMEQGELTGRTVIDQGAAVSMTSDATCLFDLRAVTPNNAALVTNLSLIQGAPRYDIVLRQGQAEGLYVLADGVAGFSKSISVNESVEGDSDLWWICNVSVGQVNGSANYKLMLADNRLVLRIGEEDPVVSGLILTSETRIVSSGGTYTQTTIGADGSLIVSSGCVANRTTVNSGGWLEVYSGGTANSTTVNNGGELHVSVGGTASSIEVRSGGCLYVANGGTATEIVENGGYVSVGIGVNVNVTFTPNTFSGLVLSSASATVHSGTTANGTTVNIYAGLNVSSGGVANSTTVNSGGWLDVSSGGVANSTMVNNGGYLDVISGGVANSATVKSNAYLYVFAGGKLTGQTTIENGANVSAFSGAILDFDISKLAPGAEARINNLSLVDGWSNMDFTLTVSGSQENGTYTLANGAADFNKTITVQNTLGELLGTLTTVGQTMDIGGVYYTLNLGGDNVLSVTVGEPGPGPEPVGEKKFFEGDFNGDLFDTLAVQKDGAVTIYQNGEPWGLGVTLDPGWEVVGTGDFSGDGLDDFLRVNDEGYVVGEMSNGNGTFSPQVLNLKNPGWDILGTGDFNGNGTSDILIANPTAASETVGLLGYWESGTMWTLINGYSPEWECVSTGDFNGDGKCDMLWRNSFEGEGGLTYNAYCTWIVENAVDWRMVSVANPDEWNFLCSGDFDGNGSHDIAMINDVGVVGIWSVNDGYLNSWSILSAVTPEWQLAGVADFNGDGTDDIAWANSDTGLVGCWQIENKELASWQTIANLA